MWSFQARIKSSENISNLASSLLFEFILFLSLGLLLSLNFQAIFKMKVKRVDTLILFVNFEKMFIFLHGLYYCLKDYHLQHFINYEVSLSFLVFSKPYYDESMLVLSEPIYALVEEVMWLLSLILLTPYIIFFQLLYVEPSLNSKMNPTWWWCLVFLKYFWSPIPSIYWQVLPLCSSRKLNCSWAFCSTIFIQLLYQNNTCFMSLETFPILSFVKQFKKYWCSGFKGPVQFTNKSIHPWAFLC